MCTYGLPGIHIYVLILFLIQAVYYTFAIFGMMIFESAIPPPANGTPTKKQVSVSISVYSAKGDRVPRAQ